MSKPARIPTPEAQGPPVASPEDIAVILERDKIYPQQREASRPADEVVERLLRRHSQP